MRGKVAVVLFNLGGPDSPEAIRPFLLNLFRDPAILRVPFFVRFFLARIIAAARLKPARENYALLGGKSPLLELTRQQADALEAEFTPPTSWSGLTRPSRQDSPEMVGSSPTMTRGEGPDADTKCFIAMRYWHPFSYETVRQVKEWQPDEIVLLPLYPQYSSTTTGSSLTAWRTAATAAGLVARTTTVCCYATDPAYVAATAALVRAAYDDAIAKLAGSAPLRVLFSAHGLPEKIVQAGDPYQQQIEQTTAAVLHELGLPDLDWVICYQSRATPVKWIDPSTDQEIERAGRDGVAVLVVPIAFVSDHSETLVELDIEYRHLAEKSGVRGYFRAPVQNADPGFIKALAGIVRRAVDAGPGLCGGKECSADRKYCPFIAR